MDDDRLTMLPAPCACITRNSCFMLKSTPSTLVSKVAAKLSAFCSVTGPGLPSVPALLTATSRRPNRSHCLVDQILHVALVADVGVDEFRFRAERTQLGDEPLAFVIAAAGNDEAGTFAGEGERGGAADAGECACDQNDLIAHGTSPSMVRCAFWAFQTVRSLSD